MMENFESLSYEQQISTLEAIQKGLFAHSEGYKTVSMGNASHAEGQETQSLNNGSHSEGRETIAGGKCSHAQGFKTKAMADYSVAMGNRINVSGEHSVGLQLDKEDGRQLTQPNTFSIVGGSVGIGTLGPSHTLEVEGTVGFVNLPSTNPQFAGSIWNYNGVLRISSGLVVKFLEQPTSTSFGQNESLTLSYEYEIYGHHAIVNSHEWQMSANGGLTWIEIPSEFIENETVLSTTLPPSPGEGGLVVTSITRSLEINNSVPATNGRLYRLVVITQNDVNLSNNVLITT
jgi:hypothetical protein